MKQVAGLKQTQSLCEISLAALFLLLGSLWMTGCQRSHKNYTIIQNKGSDTLVNLAQVWAEAYRNVDSSVVISVSGGGSGTGIAALINNQVDIANSSRAIKPQEKEEAEKNSGKKIKGYVVAYDALSVFVHPTNPLQGLTKDEVACIYGTKGNCNYWHQIRNTMIPGCKNNKIIRVSRQSNSGTYQYFLESLVGKDQDLRLGSMDLNGSKESIDFVEHTPCAIGYTGMGYLNPRVKPLCIQKSSTDVCVYPTVESTLNKTYPVARELFFYVLGEPKPEILKYFEWIKSPAATELITKMGYVPSGFIEAIEKNN